ncbi:MAG TPA: glucose-6-phosphate isomerase [Bacilli bacterium]|nr:glucose-6-phosphate isomerase [Bacilli bacterium]
MTKTLRFNYSNALKFVKEHEMKFFREAVMILHRALHTRTGVGSDYLGWLDLPSNHDRAELLQIQQAAERIQEDSDVLLVIGIGGSYLGARAAIEALNHTFYNLLPQEKRKTPQIFFAGHNISSIYLDDLFSLLDGKDVSINVISKSGTTTEPAIAFRLFRDMLEKKYGKQGAKSRIYVTTDEHEGALKKMADGEGYETFVIPRDIGGRYSVLSAVGLLPIAVSGLDIEAMLNGARQASVAFSNPDLEQNEAYQYAAIRNALYRKGKMIELFVSYEPSLTYTAEWWKQLFGESEGKDGKGIFPASLQFTTDLHSLGQYVQDGRRNLFETIVQVERTDRQLLIETDERDLDGLNYLANESIDNVNKKAFEATMLAHTDGDVPNLIISLPELTEFHYGYMLYFFEKACAMSGYLLGVNPFDQPGVEQYKENMFALLEKPGFSSQRELLEKRIK